MQKSLVTHLATIFFCFGVVTSVHAAEFVPEGRCVDKAAVEALKLNCGLLEVTDEQTGEPIPVSLGEWAEFMGISVDRLRCINGWPEDVTGEALIPDDVWFSDSGSVNCD